MPAHGRPSTVPISAQVIGLAIVAACVLVIQGSVGAARSEVVGAVVVIPLIVGFSLPLLMRAGRADPDPRFLGLLLTAFALKGMATSARYWITMVHYDGVADASSYAYWGKELAASYSQGHFGADLGGRFIGTGFLRALTGVVYTLTGQNIYTAYAVFACFGFWGVYFFYRAFQTAVPDGNHRRYALLVLFLPSLLFWPASIGKESWMMLGLGLAAWGAARLLAAQKHWLLPLAAGLGATAVLRPHVTALVVAGVAVATALRPPLRRASVLNPLTSTSITVAVVVVALFAATMAADFLHVQDLSGESVGTAASGTEERTSQGGSAFDAVAMTSPLQFPWAAITVLFRPFVFEADTALMLLTAVEVSLLAFVAVASIPRLRRMGGRLRQQPYLILCIVYSALFIYAFSYIGNFGILARQRVQLLPFVLVFLALPALPRKKQRHSEEPVLQESSS